MKTRTFLRLLLGLAALVAGLVALTPWLVRRYLPPERVRALIAEKARESLGREVRIGDITYGIWGVKMHDVAISEKPDFSAGIFASAGRLSIRPSWLALLKRAVVINSVSVENGRLHYADAKAGQAVEVSGLALTVSGFKLKGPFDASLALSASGRSEGRPFEGRVTAAARIDLGGSDPRAFQADIRRFELGYQGLVATGEARVDGLSPADARVKLTISAAGRPLASAQWSGSVAAGLKVDGNLSLKTDELSGARLQSLGLPAGLIVPPMTAAGGIAYSGDKLALKDFKIDAAAGDVEATGFMSGLKSGRPTLAFQAKCPAFDLRRISALDGSLKELSLSGGGSFDISANGRWPKPLLSGQGRFQDIGAVLSGLALAGFTGKADFSGDRIDLRGVRGRVGDGQLKLDLTVKNYAVRPDIEIEAGLDQFDLGRWLGAKAALSSKGDGAAKPAAAPASGSARRAPEPATSAAASPSPIDSRGHFTVGRLVYPNMEARQVSIAWQLSGLTADFKQLNGTASLSSKGGFLRNLGELAASSKSAKVLLFPLMVVQKIGGLGGIRLFPDFNDVSYSELAGNYSFDNGLMTLSDSHLNTDAGNVVAQGHIDLPHEQLDMTVIVQVGKTPIEVAVGGTFDHPKTRLNAQKLLNQSAKQLLEGPAKQLLQQLFK